jgi:hypothetical protein
MSQQDYIDAVGLLEQNSEISDFVGRIAEETVRKAENKIGITFPPLYREFVLNYGAGNFGSEEIYGILKDDFDNSGIPDAVWFTLKQREEIDLPRNLVIIYHTGGEEMFCIDVSQKNEFNESPIVSYSIGLDPEHQKNELIARDFGEFFLQRVKSELGLL